MIALILLAGYGSRLGREDLPHKVLLPFGEETLLSRHLKTFQDAGIPKTVLVVGHNREAVKAAVQAMDLTMPVEFVDNDEYLTTGNTLSLVMGLRGAGGTVLVMDGDVLYPREVLQEFLRNANGSVFAVVPVDIDDQECAKVLLKENGTLAALVTKRALTEEEKERYTFGGEAIGFFTLSPEAVQVILRTYQAREEFFKTTLWEVLFSEIAGQMPFKVYRIEKPGCFEIDTREDYEEALRFFREHPELY